MYFILLICFSVNLVMPQASQTPGFTKGDKLGRGINGNVHRICLNGNSFAIKSMSKRIEMADESIYNEIKMLHSLNHNNIVKLQQYWEDSKTVNGKVKCVNYLLELCSGNLLDLVKLKWKYLNFEQKSVQLKQMALQIFDAVSYLHKNGIYHRDIKPDNILYVKNTVPGKPDETIYKLADFEFATTKTSDTELAGTLSYLPPEAIDYYKLVEEIKRLMARSNPISSFLIDEKNDKELEYLKSEISKFDIYALGKSLYILSLSLTNMEDANKMVYMYGNCFEEEDQIKEKEYKALGNLYKAEKSFKNDPDFQKLIRKMMHCDPYRRPSIDRLLNARGFLKKTLKYKWLAT